MASPSPIQPLGFPDCSDEGHQRQVQKNCCGSDPSEKLEMAQDWVDYRESVVKSKDLERASRAGPMESFLSSMILINAPSTRGPPFPGKFYSEISLV
jgi:hypothetical protein